MQENYDLVIIGGGPSGLALAQCCSSLNKKVLIIEREDDIGGCHRVKRYDVKNKDGIVERMFTEHAPRVYSSTYKVFMELLKDMNLNFYDLFTPYHFSIATIGGQTVWSTMSFNEMFTIFIDFLMLILNDNHGKNISMKEYGLLKKFQPKSNDMIDRICRLTDGATAEKYTLNEFLQLFNQQFLYTLFQPKNPTDTKDIGLFSLWKNHLKKNNVDFLLNTTVENFIYDEGNYRITHARGINQGKIIEIKGDKFIMAIPPIKIVDILEKSNIKIRDAFGDFNNLKNWSENTDYIDYISVTFHWDTKLNLEQIYGFPKTEWGVAYIVLSDYMNFQESQSKTMISTTATITNVKSKNNNKTANECIDKLELVKEIFSQLKQSFPNLPPPTVSILSPELEWENGSWESKDTAFIASSNQPNLPFDSKIISNLFNLGTHNGKNLYKFTSMESAVTNGVSLSHLLFPELKHKYPIISSFTTKSIILLFILLVCIIYVYFY